jgi:hypothetical protein
MINEAQGVLSTPRSGVVISSTDLNVRQLTGLANQEGRELSRRCKWESLVKEKTFTSVAAPLQTSSVASDFDYIVNHTMYNRSQYRRVTGPLSAVEWQAQQALSASLLIDSFRFRGGDIYISPTPDAGDTYAYEYMSLNWCESSGGTGQAAWAADTDVGILDETLMVLGIIWRFRKARSLDYAEEFNTYEKEVEQAIMRDGGARDLQYGNDNSIYDSARYPLVPDGNWSL